MPSLVLSKSAEKEFAQLTNKEKKKIFRKFKALQKNPFLGKLLGGKLKGLWSCRAWPYRIIYEFRSSNKLIIVHKVTHRQKAYK